MTVAGRWTLAGLAVVAALVVALALQLRQPTALTGPGDVAPDPAALAAAREHAALPPCPAGTGDIPALHGISVGCAADGSTVAVERALAVGTPVVLNLWAYWCAPCARELPALAQYQRDAGPAVTVVTVHQDPAEATGLARLADLGVALPTLQDPDRRIAGALGVPNVMPATVVLRSDGSVAQVLPREFDSAAQIADAVAAALR